MLKAEYAPSRYIVEKGNREFRKHQKKIYLEQLDNFFELDHVRYLLREKGLASRMNLRDLDLTIEEEKDIPDNVIVSKDRVSQILIGKGYKRLRYRERLEKNGLMYFFAPDEAGLPAKMIVVKKDMKKNKFSLTVYPTTRTLISVQWESLLD